MYIFSQCIVCCYWVDSAVVHWRKYSSTHTPNINMLRKWLKWMGKNVNSWASKKRSKIPHNNDYAFVFFPYHIFSRISRHQYLWALCLCVCVWESTKRILLATFSSWVTNNFDAPSQLQWVQMALSIQPNVPPPPAHSHCSTKKKINLCVLNIV